MVSQVFSVQENHILFPWGLFLRLSSNFPNPYFIEADTLFREFFHMYSKLFRFNYFLEQTRPSMGSQVFSLRANHFLFPWGLLEELIEPEKLLYRRTAILCGGCGWRKALEDCSFFDRRLGEREKYDPIEESGQTHTREIDICSLRSSTRHFLGAWKFDEDFLILAR